MKLFISALSILAICFGQCTLAEEVKTNTNLKKIYVGAGFNHNRIDSSSFGGSDSKANGFQVFAGYEYGQRSGIDISAEAGLIQTGELIDSTGEDADGIWVAGVAKKDLPEIHKNLTGIARLGYGLSGDDGILMGFGAQVRVHPQAFIRLEYVNKDLTQSYQLNAVYKF